MEAGKQARASCRGGTSGPANPPQEFLLVRTTPEPWIHPALILALQRFMSLQGRQYLMRGGDRSAVFVRGYWKYKEIQSNRIYN